MPKNRLDFILINIRFFFRYDTEPTSHGDNVNCTHMGKSSENEQEEEEIYGVYTERNGYRMSLCECKKYSTECFFSFVQNIY